MVRSSTTTGRAQGSLLVKKQMREKKTLRAPLVAWPWHSVTAMQTQRLPVRHVLKQTLKLALIQKRVQTVTLSGALEAGTVASVATAATVALEDAAVDATVVSFQDAALDAART